MMKLLKTVNTKGVQDSGVNPSGDILLKSVLFEECTWLGIGQWICCVLLLVRWLFETGNQRDPAL